MAISDFIDTQPFLDNLIKPETIGGIGAAVLGLNQAKKANQGLQDAYGPNAYDQQYQQLSNQLMQLTGQLADTNNPQFQARVQQRMDEIMRQYEKALRQQQAVEARRYGRTGMGMINPERRDESLNRSLAAFRSQAEAQARNEALNEMVQAAKTGTAAAQVPHVGSQAQRGREVAGANVNNAYGQAKNSAYLALANQVLGPLLKGVDFNKLVGGSTNIPAYAAPKIESAMGSPEYGLAAQNLPPQFGQAAAPTFDAGALPAWSDQSFDIGGWNDYLGGFNQPDMTMADFPQFESAALPEMDAGGYNFDFPQFDAGQFQLPQFDFPDFGNDFGGFFDPGYGY